MVYSCCISGRSRTVTLGVIGCHPVVGEFMFRFFSFPGIFFASVMQNCLLNAEVFQPVYLV